MQRDADARSNHRSRRIRMREAGAQEGLDQGNLPLIGTLCQDGSRELHSRRIRGCAEETIHGERPAGQANHWLPPKWEEAARLELHAEDVPSTRKATTKATGNHTPHAGVSALEHEVDARIRQHLLHVVRAWRERPAEDPVALDKWRKVRGRCVPHDAKIRGRRTWP